MELDNRGRTTKNAYCRIYSLMVILDRSFGCMSFKIEKSHVSQIRTDFMQSLENICCMISPYNSITYGKRTNGKKKERRQQKQSNQLPPSSPARRRRCRSSLCIVPVPRRAGLARPASSGWRLQSLQSTMDLVGIPTSKTGAGCRPWRGQRSGTTQSTRGRGWTAGTRPSGWATASFSLWIRPGHEV